MRASGDVPGTALPSPALVEALSAAVALTGASAGAVVQRDGRGGWLPMAVAGDAPDVIPARDREAATAIHDPLLLEDFDGGGSNVAIVSLDSFACTAVLELWFPAGFSVADLPQVGRMLSAVLDASHAGSDKEEALVRLEALEEIARALAQAVTPSQVARAILDTCADALGAVTASLALVDHEKGMLQLLGVTGLPTELVQDWMSFKLDRSTLLGEAAVLGAPVYIDTAEERDRRFPALRPIGRVTGSGPVAAVPLHLGGEVIATLALTFPGTRRVFTREERLFLSEVAFHCAAALARSRLLEREQRASRTLEGALERTGWLHVLAAALSSSADERGVLDALAAHGGDAVAARALAVLEPAADGSITLLLRDGWPSDHPDAATAAVTALAARAIYGLEPLVIETTGRADADPNVEALREAFGDCVVALVPYHEGEGRGGALAVVLDETPGITAVDHGLLTAVAELLGQALARARLFESARDAEERLRAVVETAVDGIIVIDERGVMQSVNPGVERIFGYPADALVGRNVSMLMPEPHRSEHDDYLAAYLAGGDPRIIGIGREVQGRRKDGSLFPVDLSVSETALTGRIFFTGIIRDITERKRAEEELRAAQHEASEASRVKSRFLETVSHELRTPLSAILGFTDLLLDDVCGPLADSQSDAVRRIRRSGQHLLQLIEEVLFYTALEERDPTRIRETVDLSELLDEIASLVRPGAEQKGVDVRLEVPDSTIAVETDASALRRILLHLCTVAVRLADTGMVTIDAAQHDGRTELRVATSATVLSEQDLTSLWEPLGHFGRDTTVSLRGLGLGFPISTRLAREIDAEIAIDSGEERGTVFSLVLPGTIG